MKPGDPIWYRQTSRGGYGYQRDIPGALVRYTQRRALVELTRADGTRVLVAVAPSNIRPRETSTPP